ncbi:SDR family NAD(P)-dependent oxidoreductase [Xinfangfangia pollutisoli]|uniref:SDR family NAD(P)-dependent oxidoreductase n=1 Tax=Xinfangfangia pollutisoli TaxID=2865960 RepID=UPI001CD735DE|nr:glucose 1-dehydrogenase [Xinfangfangia pollutisoli]
MYLKLFDLSDRVAVITGGGRGIGLEIGRALGQAGARLVLADIDSATRDKAAAQLTAEGLEAVALPVDVTDTASVASLADSVMDRFGRVDILVNNAGVSRLNAALDISDEEWRWVMEVNSNAVFWCARAFGRHMLDAGKGAIVNLGSMSGLIINRPQFAAHYMASKAATHHITKALAVEWATRGVRVNAIAPGYIGTEMTMQLKTMPEVYDKNIDMTPMGRFGEPSEIAAAALFLASDASSYCTGSILSADGGYTAW